MLSRPKIVFEKTVIYRLIGKVISDKKMLRILYKN